MRDKSIFKLHASICKALGHPLRIEIIDLLQDKELSFGAICQSTGELKSNLSQHLSLMTSKGILNQRKEGLNSYYKLSSDKVAIACGIMREVLVENLEKQKQLFK